MDNIVRTLFPIYPKRPSEPWLKAVAQNLFYLLLEMYN